MVARYVFNHYNLVPPIQPESVTMTEAFDILLELAQKDHYHGAYFFVAECYEQGLGVAKSVENAIFWFQQAAEQCLDMAVESERRIARLQASLRSGEDLECIPEEGVSDAGKYIHIIKV
jgi:TPR repeat protein